MQIMLTGKDELHEGEAKGFPVKLIQRLVENVWLLVMMDFRA